MNPLETSHLVPWVGQAPRLSRPAPRRVRPRRVGIFFKGLISLATIPLLAGCSSFNREWKTALNQPIPIQGLAGPWEGHWVSDSNGHNDRLRCLITEQSPNQYSANFHANYKKVFHFGYTVPLEVRQNGDTSEFSGEANLGKMAGGVYTYTGHATGTNFFSTYTSKYDHGKFEMTRPQPTK